MSMTVSFGAEAEGAVRASAGGFDTATPHAPLKPNALAWKGGGRVTLLYGGPTPAPRARAIKQGRAPLPAGRSPRLERAA
eukprot:scaffold31707_cov124-Isochrysis_galbana.AAC.9